MLKIYVLELIFANASACGRKCLKSSFKDKHRKDNALPVHLLRQVYVERFFFEFFAPPASQTYRPPAPIDVPTSCYMKTLFDLAITAQVVQARVTIALLQKIQVGHSYAYNVP